MDAPSALASTKDAPLVGVDRVVLKTASITPDAAADYLVRCLGLRRVTDDEDPTLAPRGRAAVRGAYGITLELRGGGDDVPEGEADAIPETSLDPPRLASVVLGSDNPAKAKNAAVRAGAASAANGERCSGDAYAGCAVTVVGFPVTFVKTSAAKGAPAVVRVGVGAGERRRGGRFRSRHRRRGDRSDGGRRRGGVRGAGRGAGAGGGDGARGGGSRGGEVERRRGADGGGGGALEFFEGTAGGGAAWRVLGASSASTGKAWTPK